MSTVMRNVAIMEEVLAGFDYDSCAKKFNISSPSVANSIRSTIKVLKEHTDIDILESSSYGYVIEKKEEIKKYLTSPFPKTSITPSAKKYLIKNYGKYYAREPGKVAADWATINKAFNRFSAWRDLGSIQDWLASEGFLVGNVLTDAMLDFAWSALQERLTSIETEQGDCSFKIKNVERTGWKNKLVMHAEIGEKGHKVIRKFSIDLTPKRVDVVGE